MPFDTSNLFQTQADINQLAFSDPLNPVNTTPGNWGINPALLTPSYTGVYRPQWEGSNGQGVLAGNYTSFWGGVNRTINPFVSPNYGGYPSGYSPYYQTAAQYTGLTQRPIDSGLSFAQNFATPLAAQLLFQGMGWRMGGAIGRATLGELGAGLTGISGFSSLGGLAGALGGSIALPASAVAVADQAYKHYYTQRHTAQQMLSVNGIENFGAGTGNLVTGQGLSRLEAAKLAKSLDVAGSKDWLLDGQQYSQIGDTLMQSGAMDNVTLDRMKNKLEQGISTVKMFTTLMGTKSFKDAAELLAQFKTGGASMSDALKSAAGINAAATYGGVTSEYLMSTVGAQAQYMFSSAGLTPYIGANVAANQYASYRNAYRQGMLSPAFVAQMGGLGGMTQSYMAGNMSLAQTPIMDIIGALLSKGGMPGGNLVSNLGQFGQMASKNPLQTIGDMALGRSSYESEMLKHPEAMLAAFSSQIKSLNLPGTIKDGRLTASSFAAIAQASGIPIDQVKSLLAADFANQGYKTVASRLHGEKAALVNLNQSFLQQQGQDYGGFNPVVAGFNRFTSGFSTIMGNVMGLPAEAGASLGDRVELAFSRFQYGDQGTSHALFLGASDPNLLTVQAPKAPSPTESSLATTSLYGNKTTDTFGKGAALRDYINTFNRAISADPNSKDSKAVQALLAKLKKNGTLSKEDRAHLQTLASRMTPNRKEGQATDLVNWLVTSSKSIQSGKAEDADTKDLKKRYSSSFTEDKNNEKFAAGNRLLEAWGVSSKELAGKPVDPSAEAASRADSLRLFNSVHGNLMELGDDQLAGIKKKYGFKTNTEARKYIKGDVDEGMKTGTFLVDEVSGAYATYVAKDSTQEQKDKAKAEILTLTHQSPEELDKLTAGLSAKKLSRQQALTEVTTGLLAKGDNDIKKLFQGVVVNAAMRDNVDVEHMSSKDQYAFMQSYLKQAESVTRDSETLKKMREGVKTGVLSFSDYVQTQVMMQQKQDYQKFSDAVTVFAKSVLAQQKAVPAKAVQAAMNTLEAHSLASANTVPN